MTLQRVTLTCLSSSRIYHLSIVVDLKVADYSAAAHYGEASDG